MDIDPCAIFNMELSSIASWNLCSKPDRFNMETELGPNLYFEPVVKLTGIGRKYSVQFGSILYV